MAFRTERKHDVSIMLRNLEDQMGAPIWNLAGVPEESIEIRGKVNKYIIIGNVL